MFQKKHHHRESTRSVEILRNTRSVSDEITSHAIPRGRSTWGSACLLLFRVGVHVSFTAVVHLCLSLSFWTLKRPASVLLPNGLELQSPRLPALCSRSSLHLFPFLRFSSWCDHNLLFHDVFVPRLWPQSKGKPQKHRPRPSLLQCPQSTDDGK